MGAKKNNNTGNSPKNAATLEDLARELEECKAKIRKLEKCGLVIETLPLIFHKLKNKLTPILGYSQMLLTKTDEEEILDRVKKIDRNASELAAHLNILKDYFQPETLQGEKGALNNIIKNLTPWFDNIKNTERVTIELDIDDKVPDDRLNYSQIETLVKEMVANSLNAIKSKGSWSGVIEIETENDGDRYHLTIRDNGIGIQEENLAMIWEPFYSKFPESAGIGLTVCEKIINNHEAGRSVTTIAGEYTEIKITFTSKKSKTIDIEKLS